MKLSLLMLAMLSIATFQCVNGAFNAQRQKEKPLDSRINVLLIKKEINRLSINYQPIGRQNISEREKQYFDSEPSSKQKQDEVSTMDSESEISVQSLGGAVGDNKNKWNRHQVLETYTKSRLLDSQMTHKMLFLQSQPKQSSKQTVPRINAKTISEKQMQHTTIYIIMILTFLISIPLVHQVRVHNSKQNLQSKQKDNTIRYCKHTKHFLISDNQMQEKMFPNLQGYSRLVKESQTQM